MIQRLKQHVNLVLPGAADAPWRPMAGGRTNQVWKIETTPSVVCKLMTEESGSPLFPNNWQAEVATLKHLCKADIAPCFRAIVPTEHGTALLYDFVEGRVLNTPSAKLGMVMSRVHRQPALAKLPQLDTSSNGLVAEAELLLAGVESADVLRTRRPKGELRALDEGYFIHRDPVLANIVDTGSRLVLIDWQCPAMGDPAEDLAVILSPAMQYIYTGRLAETRHAQQFLAGYENPAMVKRYHAMKPFYHYRMAAHCLWKAHRGAGDYEIAFRHEFAALEKAI